MERRHRGCELVKTTVKRKRTPTPRTVIGWREWVHLPDLLPQPIKAKLDTGARTSALHAYQVEPYERDGTPWISFSIHPVQRHAHPEIQCHAPLLGQRLITSSNGHQQLRYVIRAESRIGDIRFAMDLSLADRDQMGFRLLIGREAMRRRFLVDPNRSFQVSQPDPALRNHTGNDR